MGGGPGTRRRGEPRRYKIGASRASPLAFDFCLSSSAGHPCSRGGDFSRRAQRADAWAVPVAFFPSDGGEGTANPQLCVSRIHQPTNQPMTNGPQAAHPSARGAAPLQNAGSARGMGHSHAPGAATSVAVRSGQAHGIPTGFRPPARGCGGTPLPRVNRPTPSAQPQRGCVLQGRDRGNQRGTGVPPVGFDHRRDAGGTFGRPAEWRMNE